MNRRKHQKHKVRKVPAAPITLPALIKRVHDEHDTQISSPLTAHGLHVHRHVPKPLTEPKEHEGRSNAPTIGGTGCPHQTGRSRKNTRRKNPAAAEARHKPGRCRNHQNGREAGRQKKPQAAFALIRPSLTYRIRSTRLPKAMSPHKKGTKRSALLSP